MTSFSLLLRADGYKGVCICIASTLIISKLFLVSVLLYESSCVLGMYMESVGLVSN